MHRLALTCALALVLAPTALAHPPKDEEATTEQAAVRADVVVKVEGMHCAECSGTIGARLKKTGPVEGFAADLDADTVTIAVTPGETLTDEIIIAAVDWAGYTVLEISRNSDA